MILSYYMLAKLLASDATAVRATRTFLAACLALCTVTAATLPVYAAGTPYGSGSYNTGTYNSTSTANTSSGPGSGTNVSSSSTAPTNTSTPSGSASTPASGSLPTATSNQGNASTQPQTPMTTTPSSSNTRLWLFGGSLLILIAGIISVWLLVKRSKKHTF